MQKLSFIFFILLYVNVQAQVVTKYPFTEGFETLVTGLGQQIPKGWKSINVGKDIPVWDVIGNNNAYAGANAMHMSFDFSKPADDWLITPPLKMTKNRTYLISFWVKKGAFPGTLEKFKVHIGKDTTLAAMLAGSEELDEEVTNEVYEQREIVYKANENANFFVGFNCYSDPLQFLLFIDEIKITELPVSDLYDADNQVIVSIFPNPAIDKIFVKSAEKGRIALYDLTGKCVHEQAIEAAQQLLDCHLLTGFYEAKITLENGSIKVQKIIVN
jgi:hypothetical protein